MEGWDEQKTLKTDKNQVCSHTGPENGWINIFKAYNLKYVTHGLGFGKGLVHHFVTERSLFPPHPFPPWHLTGKWTNVIPVIAPLSDIIIVHITILLLILIITIVVSTMYDTWLGNELMWSRRLRHYLRSHQAHHHCRKNHWRQMRSQCQIYHISILESL